MTSQKKFKKHTRTRLKPAEYEKIKGSIESHQYRYDEKNNIYIKHIRKIQGVAAARKNAKVFHLAVNVGATGRMYLTADGKLSYNREDARPFYEGFDEPANRIKYWNEITQVKLFDVH